MRKEINLHSWGRAAFWSSMIIIVATGGLWTELIGTLYLLDVMMVVAAVFLTFAQWTKGNGDSRWLSVAPIVILTGVLGAVSFDALHSLPLDDLLRGVGRNAVFGSAILVGANLALRFGLRLVVVVWCACSLCVMVGNFIQAPYMFTDLGNIFKYTGAQAVIYILLCVTANRPLLHLPIAISAGAGCWLIDNRSAAVIFITSGLLIGGRAVLRGFTNTKLIILFPIITTIGVAGFWIGTRDIASDDYSLLRRPTADIIRLDMAEDAWAGFVNSPLIGNGTWQHARTYLPVFREEYWTDGLIGVHSVVLQLAYEYGVSGLLFGVGCVLLLGSGLRRVLAQPKEGGLAFLIPVSLFVLYHLLFSPFANVYRNLYGLGLGIMAFVAMTPSVTRVTKSQGVG